jgi:hypothetical protein
VEKGAIVEKFKEWWRGSPQVRMWTRQVVATLGGWVAASLVSGFDFTQLKTILAGLITGAITAFIGLTTGVEPFVGINKADNVQVPVPPAVPET